MKELQQILTTFDDWLWGNWLLFVLLGVGLLYTIITGGIQIRRFGYIIRKTIWEPILSKSKESKEAGTISSFQALCTAVASCVGSGNIVGVSTAVLAGGMGAIFWMWVAAFVGMATKYGEIILGMLYREKMKREITWAVPCTISKRAACALAGCAVRLLHGNPDYRRQLHPVQYHKRGDEGKLWGSLHDHRYSACPSYFCHYPGRT